MTNDVAERIFAGLAAGTLTYAAIRILQEGGIPDQWQSLLATTSQTHVPTIQQRRDTQVFSCDGCGALFLPGRGPDNIFENYEEADIPAVFEAFRDGECPACGEEEPGMDRVL